MFSLALMPGPADRGAGLPAVRVSLPPGPPGRRETLTISPLRGDGWMTATDEPTLVRVPSGGAELLVTLYWSSADGGATAPALKLTRLNPDAPGQGAPTQGMPQGMPQGGAPLGTPQGTPVGMPLGVMPQQGMPAALFGGLPAPGAPPGLFPPARAAEIVAHIEGVGDVDGKLGDWVGMRGSGRAIEGFSITPSQGIAPGDFEIRAVLGRDWLSPWLPGGSFCGSRGLALPLRGFCLRLRPTGAARIDLACFARFVDGSEVGPLGSDRPCVAPSLAPLEAFQVVPRPRVG